MTETDDFYEHVMNEGPETQEPKLDPAAVQKLTRSYYATDLGEARESAWWALSDEEREALEQTGVTGPLHGRAGDAPVQTLGKQELRMMDRDARREATQEFEATTKRAEGEFQAGLSSLMRGELDASQQTLDQVAAIRDKVAVTVDENERSALLQKGAAIIRSLRDTDDRATFNPSAVQKTRQFFDGLTRRHMLTETDTFGNERTRELDRDDTPEAFVPKRAEPLPDTVPSVEEYLSWPIDKRHRYAREKPEDYRALLTATDR